MVKTSSLGLPPKIRIKIISKIIVQRIAAYQYHHFQWYICPTQLKIHQSCWSRHQIIRRNMGWWKYLKPRCYPQWYLHSRYSRDWYRVDRRTNQILEDRWSSYHSSFNRKENIRFWWIQICESKNRISFLTSFPIKKDSGSLFYKWYWRNI